MSSSIFNSLAGQSPLPDGIYGVSPTALQLKYAQKADFSNLIVYSSGTNGSDTVLNTNFNTGKITQLNANTSYFLDVRGVRNDGSQSSGSLVTYGVTTWDVFANSTWTITAGSDPTGISLSGSSYQINWTYAPWKTTPAGDGVLAATNMQCFFAPDAGPNTNVFTASAPSLQAPAQAGTMAVSAGAVGLTGNVRIGCQINYADGTFSRSPQTQLTLLVPAIANCPVKSVNVYQPYTCAMSDILGSTNASGLTLAFDGTNTCGWLAASSSGISGTPHDPAVGTCTLAYKLTSSSGASSPVLSQTITVNNVAASWTQTPQPVAPMREITPNDSTALTNGVLNLTALQGNPNFTLHMVNQFQTNKAAYGTVDGKIYGAYKLDNTTTSNCARLGTYLYLDSSGNAQMNAINPNTGEFYFQPFTNVYGGCTVDIYFDDGHATNNLSTDLSIPVNFQGYNDPPVIQTPNYPQTGPNNTLLYNCGSHCYIGIDYDVPLQANSGGINPAHPSITGEPDQTIMIKPGNCIAVNSNANDTTQYVQLNYCQLNTQSGFIDIGFVPLKMPPAGETVMIEVKVSDNGARGATMTSAYNPNPSGTNSDCLANSPAACAPANCTTAGACPPFPNSYADSNTVSFTLDLAKFSLPIQPALIVSKGACLACHLTVTSGDYITDMGNTPPGAQSRFAYQMFSSTGAFSDSATHIEGYRSINQLAGNFYVKRATLNKSANPSFFNSVGNLSSMKGNVYPTLLRQAPANQLVDLLDFLTSWNWTYLSGNADVRYSDGYVSKPNAFVSVCGPNPSVGDPGNKSCTPAPVTDMLTVNGVSSSIDYMTISAPTASDIQAVAQNAPPGSGAKSINWSAATGAAVAPAYIIPTDPNVLPRPFTGLTVSNMQPKSAATGGTPVAAGETYVTNSGTIQCYGDVVVKGDLFLEAPNFVSDNRGCRIHVTGSVFFHANSTQSSTSAAVGDTVTGTGNVGVQITSAVAIAIGFTQTELATRGMPAATMTSAANLRLPSTTECLTKGNTFERFADIGNRICSTSDTTVTDTTVLPSGYAGWSWGYVNYSGLMLNAPVVQGRYQGILTGSVISDWALFRLGEMNFAFDPRFSGQVPFPRLQTITSTLGNHPRIIFDAGHCGGTASDSWQCDPTATQ